MKLFATIRKESKYYHQQKYDGQGNAVAFEVQVDIDKDPFYPLSGGPGGAYSFFDVEIYAYSQGNFVKLPFHSVEHFPSEGFFPEQADGSNAEMTFQVQVERKN